MKFKDLIDSCDDTLSVVLGTTSNIRSSIESQKKKIDAFLLEAETDPSITNDHGVSVLLAPVKYFDIFKYIISRTSDKLVLYSKSKNLLMHYLQELENCPKDKHDAFLYFIIMLVKSKYGKDLCNWEHEGDLPIHYCTNKFLFIEIYSKMIDEYREKIIPEAFDQELTDPKVLEFLREEYKDFLTTE